MQSQPLSTALCLKRIEKEIREIQEMFPFILSAEVNEAQTKIKFNSEDISLIRTLDLQIEGQGIYEGKKMNFTIYLPEEYPMKNPLVFCRSNLFHPNIHGTSGFVCIDLINHKWKPTMTLFSVIDALNHVLKNPAVDLPQNPEAAVLFQTRKHEFVNKSRRSLDAK